MGVFAGGFCFFFFSPSAEFGSGSGRFGSGSLARFFFFSPQLSCEASGRRVGGGAKAAPQCSLAEKCFSLILHGWCWVFGLFFFFSSCLCEKFGLRQAGRQAGGRDGGAAWPHHRARFAPDRSAICLKKKKKTVTFYACRLCMCVFFPF